MLEILEIIFTVVFIVDYSGIIPKLSRALWNKFNPNVPYDYWMIPLISCSLCTTFWTLLIFSYLNDYTLINGLFISTAGGYSTFIVIELMHKIKDLTIKLINKI